MKKRYTIKFRTLFIVFFLLILADMIYARDKSTTILFDEDWLFFRGGAQGAEQARFNDISWRKINLPHDWSIEDIPGTHSPFDSSAISQVSGGFTMGGTGWYRKHFRVDVKEKGQRFVIQFDGIYMNAEIWLNGKSVSKHPYGYTSFWFDITDNIKIGTENVISVRVRNEGENSRWYSGSGIYRHVWFKTTAPLHIAHWGTFISTLSANASQAIVNVKTKVINESKEPQQVKLITRVRVNSKWAFITKDELIQDISSGSTFQFNQIISIPKPDLWSVDSPSLYTAVSELYVDGNLVDSVNTKFGIRIIACNVLNGFSLNGNTLKLKGGCIHHDNGPLGSKAYDRAEERKIELLKAAGYNAIRCAHNPPSPALLDACDRLGMLVIDEAFDCWEGGKNPFDYHLYFKDWWQRDIESMVIRDRNHPSVIMWSSGNEIPNREKPAVVEVAKKISELIHQLDSTRLVTCGVNGVEENKDPFFATLDVAGYNYASDKYESDHLRLPERVMFATESFPSQSFNYWKSVQDHSWVIGDFVWTAFDYIGEASIGWLGYPQQQGFYPWSLAYCGDIDICGWKRPQSYYRNALWKPNQLSLFVKPPKPTFDTASFKKEDWSHWDWPDVVKSWNWKVTENKPLQIVIYSSCEEVELFLNNKSLGKKITGPSSRYLAEFTVPFQPGTLKAVGYSAQKQVAFDQIISATDATQLKLIADRKSINADGQDLCYLTVEVVDKNGVLVTDAVNLIKFKISNNATIAGVGNADPRSLESYQLPQRKAFHGKSLLIVKSSKISGNIFISASSNGLRSAQTIIYTK